MKLHGSLRVTEAVSRRMSSREAVREATEQVIAGAGAQPDLAAVFLSPHHVENSRLVLDEMQAVLAADVVVGATASGVIGGGIELQEGPGLAVWAARLPGARVQSFHLRLEETETGGMVRGWPDAGPDASAVLLADPFSFPLDPFLRSLRKSRRAPRIVGGVASGAFAPGGNRLFCDDAVHQSGAVGFVMDGAVTLQPVLTQGCRSVGRRFTVTRCEKNIIYELSEGAASERLQETLRGLDEADRECFRRGPQLGLLVGDGKECEDGGFLIRGVMGVDTQSGSVMVNDLIRAGRTVQFFARDGRTATEEMDSLLGLASGMMPESAGALLFTCNGRGRHLFEAPNHDVEALRKFYPRIPVAGFFAAGEVGPVCGQPYLHGFTASAGLLVARETD